MGLGPLLRPYFPCKEKDIMIMMRPFISFRNQQDFKVVITNEAAEPSGEADEAAES